MARGEVWKIYCHICGTMAASKLCSALSSIQEQAARVAFADDISGNQFVTMALSDIFPATPNNNGDISVLGALAHEMGTYYGTIPLLNRGQNVDLSNFLPAYTQIHGLA
jgi:hypothetical protein